MTLTSSPSRGIPANLFWEVHTPSQLDLTYVYKYPFAWKYTPINIWSFICGLINERCQYITMGSWKNIWRLTKVIILWRIILPTNLLSPFNTKKMFWIPFLASRQKRQILVHFEKKGFYFLSHSIFTVTAFKMRLKNLIFHKEWNKKKLEWRIKK